MKTHNLLAAAVLLLATGARAEPRNQVSAGLSLLMQMGTFRPAPDHMMVEVLGLRTAAEEGPLSALQFGGGLRTGWPWMPSPLSQVPLEGFLRVQLGTKLGIWRPTAGIELGLSGFNDRVYTPLFPDNRQEGFEDARIGPAYGSFTASPVRLQLGRFQVSTLQLNLGTSLHALGTSVRIQLGLLSLGGSL
jgi:hypothetical protein